MTDVLKTKLSEDLAKKLGVVFENQNPFCLKQVAQGPKPNDPSDQVKWGYTRLNTPLTNEKILDHVRQRATYGVFPDYDKGTTSFGLLDFDICSDCPLEKRELAIQYQKEEVLATVNFLRDIGLNGNQYLLTKSGTKGYHLLFWMPDTGIDLAIRFLRDIRANVHRGITSNLTEIETRPCHQKYGVKLPLGINRKGGPKAFCGVVDPRSLDPLSEDYNEWIKLSFERFLDLEPLDISTLKVLARKEPNVPEERKSTKAKFKPELSAYDIVSQCPTLQAMGHPSAGHIGHEARVMAAMTLACSTEGGLECIQELLNHCSDFDSDKTEKEYDRIKEKYAKGDYAQPPSCLQFSNFSFSKCDTCPRYSWFNERYLGQERIKHRGMISPAKRWVIPEQGKDFNQDSGAQVLGPRAKKSPFDPHNHRDYKMTQSEELIWLADEDEFFHTPDNVAYVTFQSGDHRETWPLKSESYKNRLYWLYHQQHKNTAPSSQAIQDALGVLHSKALFDGQEYPVLTRIASHDDAMYVDLANDKWEAVKITKLGWEIVSDPPVKFRRTNGMKPLPRPEHNGNVTELKSFINVGDEADFQLMVSWIVGAYRPQGPYPILVLQGEQGSSKSTSAKMLRSLIDPSSAPLRSIPKDERDLMINATNCWILAFDNLSGLKIWISDALCRLATGGGFATRELYSDDKEKIFSVMRPVMITGIGDIVSRHDLIDRALTLNLPPIPDNCRKPEVILWKEFDESRPKILGALYDAISTALRNIDKVKLGKLPRMADFAHWIVAAEEALPWDAGSFMQSYTGNRADAIEVALQVDPVSDAIITLVTKGGKWEGSAKELLECLESIIPYSTRYTREWPDSPQKLSNYLKRISPAIRNSGIRIEYTRSSNKNRKRLIHLISDDWNEDNQGQTESSDLIGLSDESLDATDNTDDEKLYQLLKDALPPIPLSELKHLLGCNRKFI